MRIGINGFGRIGRCITRAFFELGFCDQMELAAINSCTNASSTAHFLKYDSVHGKFRNKITHHEKTLEIEDKHINILNCRTPDKLPWRDLGVDLVMECTGQFKTRNAAEMHTSAGAHKVIISSPATGEDCTVIYGINHEQALKPEASIIAAGSCTTNCLVPVLQVIQQTVGIVSGFVTTIHAYTNDQRILDASHKDLYRSRACAMSIIPSSTGAKDLIPKVLPELKGKIDIASIRVPTPNVSMIDLTVLIESETTLEQMNAHFLDASSGRMRGILGYTNEALVSCDFIQDTHSAIFDSSQTSSVGNKLFRIVAWYDNEWAFAVRMLDIATYIAHQYYKKI